MVLPFWQSLPKYKRVKREEMLGSQGADHDALLLQPPCALPQPVPVAPPLLHNWTWASTQAEPVWRCISCLTFVRNTAQKAARSQQLCPGAASKLVSVAESASSLGHTLQVAEYESLAFFSCSRCMAYGTALPRKLLQQCHGANQSAYASFVASRIQRGIHPKLGVPMTRSFPLLLDSSLEREDQASD